MTYYNTTIVFKFTTIVSSSIFVSGYNGTFPFEKPGDPYGDHNYIGMRIVCTAMGAALVPLRFVLLKLIFHVMCMALFVQIIIFLLLYLYLVFSYLTVWEMTQSLTASSIAGALMLFDVGVLILNRYILLDPILLFFISAATYAMVKFRNYSHKPFSQVIRVNNYKYDTPIHMVLK